MVALRTLIFIALFGLLCWIPVSAQTDGASLVGDFKHSSEDNRCNAERVWCYRRVKNRTGNSPDTLQLGQNSFSPPEINPQLVSWIRTNDATNRPLVYFNTSDGELTGTAGTPTLSLPAPPHWVSVVPASEQELPQLRWMTNAAGRYRVIVRVRPLTEKPSHLTINFEPAGTGIDPKLIRTKLEKSTPTIFMFDIQPIHQGLTTLDFIIGDETDKTTSEAPVGLQITVVKVDEAKEKRSADSIYAGIVYFNDFSGDRRVREGDRIHPRFRTIKTKNRATDLFEISDKSPTDGGIGGPEWQVGPDTKPGGTKDLNVSPNGNGYIGRFGKNEINLRLTNLPTHGTLTVSFKLILFGKAWNGGTSPNWNLKVTSGKKQLVELLNTTFSNDSARQMYPLRGLGGATSESELNAARTGALDTDLGYTGKLEKPSAYPMSFSVPWTDNEVTFIFSGVKLPDDAEWGIDDVQVNALPVPQQELCFEGFSSVAGTLDQCPQATWETRKVDPILPKTNRGRQSSGWLQGSDQLVLIRTPPEKSKDSFDTMSVAFDLYVAGKRNGPARLPWRLEVDGGPVLASFNLGPAILDKVCGGPCEATDSGRDLLPNTSSDLWLRYTLRFSWRQQAQNFKLKFRALPQQSGDSINWAIANVSLQAPKVTPEITETNRFIPSYFPRATAPPQKIAFKRGFLGSNELTDQEKKVGVAKKTELFIEWYQSNHPKIEEDTHPFPLLVFGKITSSFVTTNLLPKDRFLSVALARVQVDYLVFDGEKYPKTPKSWKVVYEPRGLTWVMTITEAGSGDLTTFRNNVLTPDDVETLLAMLTRFANEVQAVRTLKGSSTPVNPEDKKRAAAQHQESISVLQPGPLSTLSGFYSDIFRAFSSEKSLPGWYLDKELQYTLWMKWPAAPAGSSTSTAVRKLWKSWTGSGN